MGSSGWNPTSMPARETQHGFVLPDATYGASPAPASPETLAEAEEER
ncbi:MAG: hypothetical protein WC709_05570 [Thermoleophilia bacterium]